MVRFDRRAMQAICCRAWGITPDVYRDKMRHGDITFSDVMAQFRLELMSHPVTAEVIHESVFGGAKAAAAAAERKRQHEADNAAMFALLTGMRRRRESAAKEGNE